MQPVGGTSDHSVSRTIHLGGVPEHFNLPWHLAMESDALADLDLDWADQPGGTGAMLAGLEDGTLDLVSILTEGTVDAIRNGLAATIIGIYVASPLQWGVYVPASSDIVEEAQLVDTRIAISRFGSGSHLMAFVQAERLGQAIGDERFVVTGGLDGARQALGGGEAELFLWDRFMTQAYVDNGEFRQIAVQPTPWPSFVFAVRDEVLLGRTVEVGRIVDAIVAEAVSLHARPGIAAELVDRYEISLDSAQGWLASTRFAERAPFDPALAAEVLATLDRSR